MAIFNLQNTNRLLIIIICIIFFSVLNISEAVFNTAENTMTSGEYFEKNKIADYETQLKQLDIMYNMSVINTSYYEQEKERLQHQIEVLKVAQDMGVYKEGEGLTGIGGYISNFFMIGIRGAPEFVNTILSAINLVMLAIVTILALSFLTDWLYYVKFW